MQSCSSECYWRFAQEVVHSENTSLLVEGDGGGDYGDDDDDEMVKVEKVMMVMMKLKMVGGEGDFDDDYDVLLRTLQTQKTLLFWLCSKQDSLKNS